MQLSPLQPAKDGGSGSWQSNWWKLYQPYGFKIATSGESPLGTRDDLKQLTAAAKEKGIRVIVDVVANHLAEGSKYNFDYRVRNYEQTIYDSNLRHGDFETSDNSVESVVRGSLGGLPDLQTESTHVQSRVVALLKDYIDCGVSGFRFDAAKHIETDEDGDFKSQFWSKVEDVTKNYAKTKLGEEAYMYGEILYTPGSGRSWGAYTKRMSLVDNNQGSAVLAGIRSNAGGALTARYNVGDANKVISWAESHDTYANDSHETTGYDQTVIDKAYVVQASRKGAAPLYFARPGSNTNIGQIGTMDWKSNVITAVNKFHNFFVSVNESIRTDDQCYVNTRNNGSIGGATLVSIGASDGAQINVGLPDGNYTNLITGGKVSVSGGKVKTSFTNGVMVISSITEEVSPVGRPSIDIQPKETVFADKTDVEISVGDATAAYYQINNGRRVKLSNGTTKISVGEGLANGEIEVKVVAASDTGSRVRSVKLTKTNIGNKQVVITNVPNDAYLAVWSWEKGKDGSWYDLERQGSLAGFDCPHPNFIIVSLTENKKASEMTDWRYKKAQTDDMEYKGTQIVLDFTQLGL